MRFLRRLQLDDEGFVCRMPSHFDPDFRRLTEAERHALPEALRAYAATRKRREAERARGGGEGSEAGPDEVEAREPTSRVVRRAGLRARR